MIKLPEPLEKPIAYFDFQERGFYWATYTYISPVPVAIKVEPIPLFTEAQLKQAVRDAESAPDCRTCVNRYNGDITWVCGRDCTNGDQYQPAPKVVLWRTE